jgi:hypothetical protein
LKPLKKQPENAASRQRFYFFGEFLKTAHSMHCFIVYMSSENGQL